MVDKNLKRYIELNIFPKYKKFYSHGMAHINRVIDTSMILAKEYGLDENMCYTIAAYHDLGLSVDRENHEKESGKILEKDRKLKKYFNQEQISIMKEAVEDHRGSRKIEPRNIYGRIVSDSDRDFDIEILAKRQLATSIKNYPELNMFDEHFERCYKYLLNRLNKEKHFNLWTNNIMLIKQRDGYEQKFLNKEYTKAVYKKEYDKIYKDGTIEKIINYYEDY